ncbi:MAG TPA: hypothetical protein VI385_13890 [Flavisolibacter sp.]
MKRSVIIFVLLFFLFSNCYSQSIQYSKGNIKVDDPAQAQLVSNLQGYNHLITFSYNKKPIIHIFDDHLRLLEQRQLDFLIRKDCDVKIVSFAGYYYLTIHIFQPSFYEVWKVDKEGRSVRLSKECMALFDTVFKDRSPALQLVNINGKLFALAQTYIDSLKAIRCKLARLDDQFAALKAMTLGYPFDNETDFLQQVSLWENALFVLKSSRDNPGNSLSLMKVELDTGDITTTSFDTGFQTNWNPGFLFSPIDSTLLVYSTIIQTDINRRVRRNVLISRLDNQLKERTPVTVLKHQFTQNTASNFLFIKGRPSVWLNVNTNRRVQGPAFRINPTPRIGSAIATPYMIYTYPNDYYYKGPTGVRFTVMDTQFKTRADTLVANDKKVIEVQSYPFGQFTIGDRVYLVLTQNFTAKRKGLIIFSSDDNGKLAEKGLPVFDKYDYLLSQLQAFDNSFIVPYSYKKEMGLMKVTLKD